MWRRLLARFTRRRAPEEQPTVRLLLPGAPPPPPATTPGPLPSLPPDITRLQNPAPADPAAPDHTEIALGRVLRDRGVHPGGRPR
ncbi:hypothetical protein ACFV5N_00780 [Streptomyces sp. NPDC059853]|uniref:hypothetical protein n=1 Tax=Streptomyces sp. NPDC059853 TaxID=3346973 RepID=UPI003650FC1E